MMTRLARAARQRWHRLHAHDQATAVHLAVVGVAYAAAKAAALV